MLIDVTSMRHTPDTHPIPTDPTRRAQWIISELKLAGSSLAAIAKELKVTRQAGALALRMGSIRFEQAIAAKLGRPVQDLFPERYRPDGTRTLRTRDAEDREAA